ncbi:short-chain alcohol dehydrogenase [Stygiomarasmius scandens]|uniref:Short-chain alcohol dehydrogenase n=1 Tax=Marasmiellus scandens TaxID=2682957 RepID=A0ABR1JA17_9AGAR
MGLVFSLLRLASQFDQHLPPKPTWSTSQIPDLSGKVIIVTGGNTGIGKDTVKALLEHNAKVYMASRNPEKAKAAIEDLKAKTGKEALFLKLDLADLKNVKAAAEEFLSKEQQLHALFNNGGVMMCPMDQLTAQGYDLQFGTNVVGHFYFTKLLLPVLISTAQSTGTSVRVVNTSSVGYTMYSKLDFNAFKDGPARRRIGKYRLYGHSKFGNIVFSNELARRFGDKGVISTAVHPGNIKSELHRHLPSITSILMVPVAYSSEMGALTQLWAGTTPDPEGKELNGKYLVPWARVGPVVKEAEDEKLGKDLWEWLEEQVKDI